MEPVVLDHPLADHFLAGLRDRSTPPAGFRAALRQLSGMLLLRAGEDFATVPCEVQTPLAPWRGRRLAGMPVLVPILRAGLAMSTALLDILPEAEVWPLGFYRDERTLRPVPYYSRLPERPPTGECLLLDPMLATAGTAIAALDSLRDAGVTRPCFLGLIAAPEGLRALAERHPEVRIYVAAVDERLDEHGYILPGLGDAGDRIFGTGEHRPDGGTPRA